MNQPGGSFYYVKEGVTKLGWAPRLRMTQTTGPAVLGAKGEFQANVARHKV